MNEDEIERIFTAIDPAAGLDGGGLDSVFDADVLTQRVVDGIRSNVPIKVGRRWRRFRRGFTVPLVLLLIASGTAAAVTLLRTPEPIRVSASMDCYSQPLKQPQLIDEMNVTTTPGHTCAVALRAAMKSGEAVPRFTPPELCVSNDNVLRVFPTVHVKNFCNTLGYAPYSGKTLDDHVARLTLAVVAFNTGHQCASIQVATSDANRLLTNYSLARSWNVHVIDRPGPVCTTLAVDDTHRIVDVVPIAITDLECGGRDVKVSMSSHVTQISEYSTFTVHVVNESDAPCALVGYADVEVLGSGSNVSFVASHAQRRNVGASSSTVAGAASSVLFVAGNGAEASFLLEFRAASTSCVFRYQNLSVRFNVDTTTHSLRLPTPVYVCVRPLVTVFASGSRGPSQ